MTVRTRFAPSPTGPLHIGSARTALFNYLFARHHGGEFLLRIEDTDRERSTEAATQASSMAWTGSAWPATARPCSSPRAQPRHAEVARAAAGRRATPITATARQRNCGEMREQARAEGRSPRYDGRWRDRDPAEAPPGVKPAIRLKAPREGETVVEDLVQGTVRVANAELDDMIILRSDGTPTYNHSVVVDDHDMAITHVIRGDDHLTNTFRQVQIYRAMGWDLPRFAHIPLIHGADGAKLSKRHGARSVLEFREQGYPARGRCATTCCASAGRMATWRCWIATRRSGCSTSTTSIAAPRRMDYAKLMHLNGIYIRQADDDRLTREVLRAAGAPHGPLAGRRAAARIRALMPALKERLVCVCVCVCVCVVVLFRCFFFFF